MLKDEKHEIKDFQCETILSLHQITTLILLDNKEDIVSILQNDTIIIFELKEFSTKLLEDEIKGNVLLDIIKLSFNRIVVISWDNLIRIIKLYENNTN